ncbi:hypothetical protein ACSSVY_004103 [Roseovarius sp. MBR-51]
MLLIDSGKHHDEADAVLATILAGATNLGVERMAYASSRVSHAQLTWAHELRQGLEQRSSAEG